MSFAKFGLADRGAELGRAVLALSVLGLFTKLLHIDLSHMRVFDVALQPANVGLIPGTLGLVLIYIYVAFLVSRMEAGIDTHLDASVTESRNRILESKPLLIIVSAILPFSIFVYLMPFVLGAIAIALLWSDSMSVLHAIWILAAK